MTSIKSYQYVDNKSSYTILYLHGWGCNMNMIKCLLLENNNFNYLLVDLPGHGNNCSLNRVYELNDYVNDVLGFIAEKHYKIDFIVAHSFGGKLSILLSSELKSIKGLFLIAPSIYNKKRHLNYYIKVYTYKLLKKLHVSRKLLDKFGSSDYKVLDFKMKRTMSLIINTDVTEQLKKLTIPIFLLFGKKDNITPCYLARKIKRKGKDVEIYYINGDHFAYKSVSYLVQKMIESFVLEISHGL